MTIRIHATGPSGGDCTYPYSVTMDKPYTVREFVDEVVSEEGNWGVIRTTHSTENRWGDHLCDYRYGEVTDTIGDDVANARVLDAWGSGGWSRYDFTLLVR